MGNEAPPNPEWNGGVNLAVQRTSALAIVTATLITGTVPTFRPSAKKAIRYGS